MVSASGGIRSVGHQGDAVEERAEGIAIAHGAGRGDVVFVGVDAGLGEFPAGLVGEELEEDALGAAVAFPEGVEGVEVGEEPAGGGDEAVTVEAAKMSPAGEVVEEATSLRFDPFGEGEEGVALAHV